MTDPESGARSVTSSDDGLALTAPICGELSLDRHPVFVLLASRGSEHSRRSYAGTFDKVAEMIGRWSGRKFTKESLPWWVLRYPHLARIKTELAKEHTPASANVRLSHLRSLLRECRRLGLMSAEDFATATDVGQVRGDRLPRGRSLTPGEIDSLLRSCQQDTSAAGVRDAALIALCYACGLRRAEVVALDLDALDRESGALKVLGKGNRERTVYLTNGGLDAALDWISERGEGSGPLLFRIRKGGAVIRERLTTQAVYDILKRRAKKAEVADFTPHDCRRTLAGDLLDRGVDIATVAKLLGHSQIGTTAKYDRRPEAAKQRAAETIHIPYRRRPIDKAK